jgi:transcriptional regulator with XRE-family HTH domain
MIKEDIGANIRRLRVERRFSQEALAHHANVSISFLKKMEAGQRQPSVTTLFKLSLALSVTPNDLVSDTFKKWQSQQE